MERKLNIYVDIDDTICNTPKNGDYSKCTPIPENIAKINKLYDKGHTITYWTARGMRKGLDFSEITKKQLDSWGCKYHELRMNEKPAYDLLICDKTRRIEEI